MVHPELGPGFDIWVGGGLSTNPMLAQRLGAWVSPQQAAEVYGGVLALFRDYGYRRLRNKARLKFLVRDWGVQRFREVLETEYLGWALADGPAPPRHPAGCATTSGARPARRTGVRRGVDDRRADLRRGPCTGSQTWLSSTAQEIRLTAWQNLVLLGVEPEDASTVSEGLAEVGLAVRPSTFRRGAMACTGIEFCKPRDRRDEGPGGRGGGPPSRLCCLTSNHR